MNESEATANEANKAQSVEAANESAPGFERELSARLNALPNASERRTFAGLTRELRGVPADCARAALEVSATLASTVGFRFSLDFLKVAPAAARLLTADELRQWGEMGRRLALDRTEVGAEFFNAGVGHLQAHSVEARRLLFALCARQMRLSIGFARETFEQAGELAAQVSGDDRLARIYEVALEISRRSAKHSADFLNATPQAVASLYALRESEARGGAVADKDNALSVSAVAVVDEAIACAHRFAVRAGGVAAEMWAALPGALAGLRVADAREMFRLAEIVIERGGAAALAAMTAAGTVLRRAPGAFPAWADLLMLMAGAGTTNLVQFARSTPEFFRQPLDARDEQKNARMTRRVIEITSDVARVDVEAALACFRSAPQALQTTSIEQFARWAQEGLSSEDSSSEGSSNETSPRASRADPARVRRSYFALETSRSHERLQHEQDGLALDDVSQTLRLYVEALTNRRIEVRSLAALNAPVPEGEARIEDGSAIHLPAVVNESAAEELNFRLYKVLAAHGAGQIEFDTHARATTSLHAAYTALAELYAEDAINALDAFSLAGYIEDVTQGERALPISEERRLAVEKRKRVPADVDFRIVLALFPQTGLAHRLFGTLENGRIDRRLRHAYKGLRRDLDFVRDRLRASRPRVIELSITDVPFELLFQITLCGGATDDARQFYSQIVSELETVVADYLISPDATVADTLMATSRVYGLFQSFAPQLSRSEDEQLLPDGELAASDAPGEQDPDDAQETTSPEQAQSENKRAKARDDARELFNQWAQGAALENGSDHNSEGLPRTHLETPEQPLAPNETAYAYDEWDRELADTRPGWCRVVERAGKSGDANFVSEVRARHRGVISSIRHQFQLMRPEGLRRVRAQLDGDDYDLDAVVDFVADRRTARQANADANPSERFYTARLRRERDTAVAFLLDQSSSTARTIGRHPLQPYTYPGRRIIEIEKEGLVLMSEALQAVGDPFAIYGFTSEGRRNVRFYVVKDFDDKLDEQIERRIGGINFEHNTRLGAAIRHAATLLARQSASTRLLIVLSDGRPYDHDYGDAAYAREDTRASLRDARTAGITPFCITIDRDSEQELRSLYGEVGYTIIDDVMNLPERIPAIYRRLTT